MASITEWDIFLAIVAIVGFIITIFKASRYFTRMESATESLTESIKALRDEIKTMGSDNRASHKRLWEHNEEQDDILKDHETRITVIEEKARGKNGV